MRPTKVLPFLVFVFLTLPICLRANTHAWTGAVSGFWSNTNNWQGGSRPEQIETLPIQIIFPVGPTRTSVTNDLYNSLFGPIRTDSLVVTGNGYHFYGLDGGTNFGLLGTPGPFPGGYTANLYCSGQNVVFDAGMNLILNGTNTIENTAGTTLEVQAAMTGDGGWTFTGAGNVTLDGTNANTSTGPIDIEGGTVNLAKQVCYEGGFFGEYCLGKTALNGPVTIGGFFLGSGGRVVETNMGSELATPLTVLRTGELDLAGSSSENIPYLTLIGGTVRFVGIADTVDVDGIYSYGWAYGSMTVGAVTNLEPFGGGEGLVTGQGGGQGGGYGFFTPAYLQFTSTAASNSYIEVASGRLKLDTAVTTSNTVNTLIKTGAGSLTLTGTNAIGASTLIEQGEIVVATAAQSPLSWQASPDTNAIVVFDGAQLTISSNCVLGAPIFINGFGTNGDGGAIVVTVDGATFEDGVVVNTDSAVEVSDAADNIFVNNENGSLSSALSGGADFHKAGPGSVTLASGYSTNFLTGTTYVDEGSLYSLCATNILQGPLVIGTSGTNSSALVEFQASGQTGSNVPVTINPGAQLNLQGTVQAIGPLTLNGGILGSGNLVLNGDISAQNELSSISAVEVNTLSLNGSNRIVTVAANSTLILAGAITNGGINSGVTKLGTGKLEVFGNSPAAGPTSIEGGIVALYNNGSLGTGPIMVANGSEVDLEGIDVGARSLTLVGSGTEGRGALKAFATNYWAGPLTIDSNTVIAVASNGMALFGGVVSGPTNASLTMIDGGTFGYYGTSANTFAGPTAILQGLLLLTKTNAEAIAGPLILGPATNAAEARLLASGQIATTALVTINTNSLLNLTNFNTTIGPLTMNAGMIQTGTGLLTLNGDVSVISPSFDNPIYGLLSLGGATRTFNCWSNQAQCTIHAAIQDGGNDAGLIKTGLGEIYLSGSNSFNGSILVSAGGVAAGNNYALGTTTGSVIVSNGGTLFLANGANVAGKSLSLSGDGGYLGGALQAGGTNLWSGPITLTAPSEILVDEPGQLTFSGVISGPGGLSLNNGILILSNSAPNTYLGSTVVNFGTLELAARNGGAVPGLLTVDSSFGLTSTARWLRGNGQTATNAAVVEIGTNTLLDLNGQSDTIGSLTGPGEVSLGAGRLSVGSDNTSTVFSGNVSGDSSSVLLKLGTGTLTLSGNSSNGFSGYTYAYGGDLVVNGQMPQSAFELEGGTLGGTGVIGPIGQYFIGGGFLEPGAPGALTSSGVSLNSSSTFVAEINGPATGSNYTQLDVKDGVTLLSATLRVNMETEGTPNSRYTIIHNISGSGASGVFAGLPEGSTVVANNGVHFQISYVGGSGADVVLTQVGSGVGPKFGPITELAGGSIQLSGTGATNQQYTILLNTNLDTLSWVSIGTVTSDSSGAFNFIDTNAVQLYPQRFYEIEGP